MYVVILAGGTGTRLWPRSRRTSPKQLLDLVDEQSMLQRTVMRVQPLLSNDRIYISTGDNYADMIRGQLPELPSDNMIVELSPRGTAPCIGLAAICLERLGQDDVMAMLHADAYIKHEEAFRQVLLGAVAAAEQGHLVTIGIEPRYPETGFGYIQRGDQVARLNDQNVYEVARFTEKPDAETAERFCDSGEYYWNSGMFVWKISRILAEFERCQPKLYAQLREIQAALGTDREAEIVSQIWDQIENQTIDVGIMEKAQDVVVVPADIGWSDIGSWDSFAEVMEGDAEGNVVTGDGQFVGIDTRDTLVYSADRLIATIGVQSLVIVDTGDALLVCPKDRAQDVKQLVNKLKEQNQQDYL